MAICGRRLTISTCGIDVLAAPESPATRLEVSRAQAAEFCAFWRDRYALTVLDLPDIRAAADCGFVELADSLLLVTTNELAALQATRRALAYIGHAAAYPSNLHLVLNRYTPSTGFKREDVKTALGLEPFAALANDYEVLQSAMLDGKPVASGSLFSQRSGAGGAP